MTNEWIYLTLLSALSLSASDACTKKVVTGQNEYIIAWLRLICCLPLLMPILFVIEAPPLDTAFFIAFIVALPLEILAVILYVKALRLSPLSLTLPFLSLTPLFLIIFSYVILAEPVTLRGGAGILLIAIGGYVLNLNTLHKGLLEPFRAILRERGSIYMIIVSFIYSFTSTLGKVAVTHSSPLFFGATYFIAVALFLAPISLRFNGGTLSGVESTKDWIVLVLSGLTFAVMIITHMFAIEIANVAYMISVKRTSLLMGVILGYLFFQERNIRPRFAGAALMFAGFVLIVTSS